jgi:hypothetical protein
MQIEHRMEHPPTQFLLLRMTGSAEREAYPRPRILNRGKELGVIRHKE